MLASPAKAQEASQPRGLAKAGPINPENGFPFWYEDHAGNRLDLCLDSDETTSKCLVPFELPEQAPEGWQPGDDFIFPDYFPGEAFWWTGEAQIERPDGGRALLVLAAESAFANEDPKEGDQMSFGRIRVRLDQLVPGATYKVTHPYGVDEIVAEEDGSIFVTEDIGCFPSPLRSCNFDKALNGRLGPFLTWAPVDGTPDPQIPAGYIADPDIPHQVQGSPITAPADPTDPNSQQVSADFFRVEGPGLGTPEKPYIETDLFSVTGKTAKLQVDATGIGAERADTAFNDADQKIELVASDEAAEVYYTTDGSEPGVADPDTGQISGTLYDPNGEGVSLNSDPNATVGVKTNLKYVAIKGEQRSEVFSKTFAVDLLAPKMSVDVAPGTYDSPQDVTFTTSERAKVYYTKDGSNPDPRQGDNPAAKSFVYDPAPEAQNEGNVIKVDRSQKIRAIAVDLDAANNDAEINWSQPKAFKYAISSLAKVGPINPENGFPFWYEDRNGTRLDMCLNPIAAPEPGGGHCATPFEMPPDWQPGDGVSFPDKFPGEAFWFTGESGVDTSDKGSADLVMAIEAAFVNEEPKASDRMVFGRVRIRVDDLVAGETYKVTHPYGTDTFVAQPVKPGSTVGEINTTEDIGCMIPSEEDPCDYNDARFSRVGPFLTKDMERAPNQSPEPTGLDGSRYLADPATDEDIVKGSPIPDPSHPSGFQNYFKVEGPDIGSPGRNTIQTDLFSIAGKYSEFQAAASKVSGFYNTPQEVTLGASEENANIFYTLDGSEPTTGGTQYSGPIAIDAMNQETTLKFIAVNPATNEQSKVFTETYTLDDTAPNVNPSVEPGAYNAAQNVALSSNEDGAKVYFTTDGSAPTDKSTLYESPIRVDSATTIKAIAIDRAGNTSEVASFDYDVQIPDTTLELDVNRNVLTFEQAAILSGKITASDPTSEVSGKRLVVEEKPAGSDEWTRARGGTTADDGSFRLGVRPDLNTAYRIQFEGDDALRASTSRDLQVNVRPKVTLGLSTDALLQGRRVVISGSVAPDHTGSVRLVIRRGTQVVARPTVRLRDSNYSYAYQPRVAGNYNARAVFAGHDDHLVGRSSLDRFQVNTRR